MRALWRVAAASILCGAALHAADRGFKDVVEAIADEFHAKPVRIPMFGLVNVVAFVARPAGARHVDLAVFEDLDEERRAGRDLAKFVRDAVGRNWKPFVQVTSRRSGHEETTLIYMREEGDDTRLLITSIERSEATVVQLRLNTNGLLRWLSFPQESAHHYWYY